MNETDLLSRLFLISAVTVVIQLALNYTFKESAAFGLMAAVLALVFYVKYLKEKNVNRT